MWRFFLLLFIFFKCVMELGCIHSSAKASICLSCPGSHTPPYHLQSGSQALSGVTDGRAHFLMPWPSHSLLSQCELGIHIWSLPKSTSEWSVCLFFSPAPPCIRVLSLYGLSTFPTMLTSIICFSRLIYMPGPLIEGTPVPTVAAA